MKKLRTSVAQFQYASFCLSMLMLVFVACNKDSLKLDLKGEVQGIQLFAPNIISTSLYERDLAIHPDENLVVFSRSDYKQSRRHLMALFRNQKDWGEATILPFSGLYDDIEPFFSPDGTKLFFASDRPLENDTTAGDFNIWVTQWDDEIWGEARPLPYPVNTEGQEYFPSVARNGNLYYTSTRSDGVGREDIYISEFQNGSYENTYPLDTNINTATFEFNAAISPDEDLIIFSSFGRKNSFGGGDLYISKKDDNKKWMSAQNLGEEINTPFLDYCPLIDMANNRVYFTSEQYVRPEKKFTLSEEIADFANQILNGMGNIYVMDMRQLPYILSE